MTRLENGPPVGYPVQFRVSGEHIDRVRAHRATRSMAKVRANPHVANVNLDWDEPSKVVRLEIDQDRARALGVSSAQLAKFLSGSLSGLHVSTYREGNELIEVLLRGADDERARLDLLGSLAVPTANGQSVPLSQIATLEYGFEDGIIWHRDRLPTITVRADIRDALHAADRRRADRADARRASARSCPKATGCETGGTVEDSARGQNSINAGVPLFLLVVVTLLMLQLRSFSRTALVLLTAPLGLIGVTLFLLVFRVPFGFVAMLGTIALAGMIMRNSVILVDQIEQDIAAGHDRWHAIIDATVRRFRPIVLTALAAILAMIPLSRSAFFGPMAVAIMGGLIGRDGADAAVPAGAVCGVVQGAARRAARHLICFSRPGRCHGSSPSRPCSGPVAPLKPRLLARVRCARAVPPSLGRPSADDGTCPLRHLGGLALTMGCQWGKPLFARATLSTRGDPWRTFPGPILSKLSPASNLGPVDRRRHCRTATRADPAPRRTATDSQVGCSRLSLRVCVGEGSATRSVEFGACAPFVQCGIVFGHTEGSNGPAIRASAIVPTRGDTLQPESAAPDQIGGGHRGSPPRRASAGCAPGAG